MSYLLAGSESNACKTLQKVFEQDANKGKELVNELCDHLLNPLQRSFSLEWLKALFSHDGSYEKFALKMQSVSSSLLCGCVWTAKFVAYRCRTCATSPCMSLCAACFENGNHTGHDYNIFRSEAGGACDCGDSSVMRKSGFCSHHGPNRIPPQPLPAGYLEVAKVLLDRILLCLIHLLRECSSTPETYNMHFNKDMETFLQFVVELAKLGSAIRSHLADRLLDETLYTEINNCRGYKCIEEMASPLHSYHLNSVALFHRSVAALRKPMIPDEIRDVGQFKRNYEYKTYLDEIMYWIVRYEFPESLVFFVLNLLPDVTLKREFSKTFTRHYPRVAASLCDSAGVEQLSNRVVHISVQLFSNEEITYMLTQEENLLEVFMMSVHNIVYPNLEQSKTTDSDFHQCVTVSSEELKGNAYWPIVSDFVNVLSHNRCVRAFLGNPDLISCWVQLLSSFSGVDLVFRAMNAHIEYEPSQQLLAFYNERESCASPLWCLLDALRDSSTRHLSLSAIEILMSGLVDLFDALGFEGDNLPHDQISFHYPLHRYVAHFIANAIKKQGVKIEDTHLTVQFAHKIVQHPLQVLTTMYEIQSGMWLRNGSHTSTQALAYKQYFFCTFNIDADLCLLQICACILPPDVFISNIFERFRITHCLTPSDVPDAESVTFGGPAEERQSKILECAFLLLASLLGIRVHLGMTEEEKIQSEALVLLCTQPCTYSLLHDHVPQCHESHSGENIRRNTALLAKCLDELTERKEGGPMEQTTYVPNQRAWTMYDPVFCEHRTLFKKNVQQAHVSYSKHMKNQGLLDSATTDSSLWPPYKPITEPPEAYTNLTNLLHSSTLHAAIFTVIYKFLHNHSVVTEITLALALHLLEGSLNLPYKPSEPPVDNKPSRLKQNVLFTSWFDSSDIVRNVVKMVNEVKATPMDVDAPHAQDPPITSRFDELSGQNGGKVKIGENMLSLLIKLHDKFSGQRGSFSLDDSSHSSSNTFIPTKTNVVAKVLRLAASKDVELEKTIRMICTTLSPSAGASFAGTSVDGGSPSAPAERLRRRQQAKEAQQRLMKQFAMKQKQFLEKVEMELVDSPDNDATLHLSGSPSTLFECVICGGTESFVERQSDDVMNLMGVVCLVQASRVLAHRFDPTAKSSGNGQRYTAADSNLERQKHMHNVYRTPDEVGGPVLGGPHLSSCGHYVHVKCHMDYVDSINREDVYVLTPGLPTGFRCPLCRRTSNMLIPCNVKSVTEGRNKALVQFCRKTFSDIFQVMSYNTNDALLKTPNGPSVLRVMVEYQLTMLNGTLLAPTGPKASTPTKLTTDRKPPIGALFHVLYQAHNRETLRETETLLMRLRQGRSWNSSKLPMPMLNSNPELLFLQMIFDVPLTLDDFRKSVNLALRAVFIQAVYQICMTFTPEERRAWKLDLNPKQYDELKLECVISHTINTLPMHYLNVIDEERSSSSTNQAYTTTVFSPQSIYNRLEELMLHFVQMAAIIQYHVYTPNQKIPIQNRGKSEFLEIAQYLGMCDLSKEDVNVLHCPKWDDMCDLLTTMWMTDAQPYGYTNIASAVALMRHHRTWNLPKLIELPSEYRILFLKYHQQTCSLCGKVPDEPAVCLVCGQSLCYKARCRANAEDVNMHAACRHSRQCGAGTCIVQLISSSLVVIIHGSRACIWGTLYLDAHGEEDRGWKRGKPLFLKKERVAVLERQWLQHSFDNECKNWTLHRNLL